jgi:hypothetical protein
MKLKPGFKVYQPKYHRAEASVMKQVNRVVANMKAAEAERQATEFMLSHLTTEATAPTSTDTTLVVGGSRHQGQDAKLQTIKDDIVAAIITTADAECTTLRQGTGTAQLQGKEQCAGEIPGKELLAEDSEWDSDCAPPLQSDTESEEDDWNEAPDQPVMAAAPDGAALTMSGDKSTPHTVLHPRVQHTQSPYHRESDSKDDTDSDDSMPELVRGPPRERISTRHRYSVMPETNEYYEPRSPAWKWQRRVVEYNAAWSHEWELGMDNKTVMMILLDSCCAEDLARAKRMQHYLSTLQNKWLCGDLITVPASTSDASRCL